MRVLLDVNVVLDVLLAREPWRADAEAIWAACDAGRVTGHLSAVTLTTIYYLVEKATPKGRAAEAVDACLSAFTIVPVTRDTLVSARSMKGDDFEDSVQIACASGAGLEAIVMRNSGDFAHSPVRVVSPHELMALLAPPP